jgi:hypothetical protein
MRRFAAKQTTSSARSRSRGGLENVSPVPRFSLLRLIARRPSLSLRSAPSVELAPAKKINASLSKFRRTPRQRNFRGRQPAIFRRVRNGNRKNDQRLPNNHKSHMAQRQISL